MQIHRLFEMTYLLMERGSMTAGELAKRFEVSTRTIYRDVGVLSEAGIPVYTDKGKGGGIRILPDFVLDKSLLSVREQEQILSSLESLDAVGGAEVKGILEKLGALFGKTRASFLEVDFSNWEKDGAQKEAFSLLKDAVLSRREILFDYYGMNGETRKRRVQPVKLYFKGQAWYVYAYCLEKEDWRFFKMKRMRDIVVTDRSFDREPVFKKEEENTKPAPVYEKTILSFRKEAGFRVFDDFPPEWVKREEDGSFTVAGEMAVGKWMADFLLSYGELVYIHEPLSLQNQIKERAGKIRAQYEKE